MKTTNLVSILYATLVCCTLHARGDGWLDQTYLHVDIGPAFVPGVNVQSGRTIPLLGPTTTTTIPFNTGVRGDIALGYNLNPSWSIELETGAVWNSADRVKSDGVDNNFYQVPILLNINCRVPLKHSWSPYLGAGVGGVASVLPTLLVPGSLPYSTAQAVNKNDFAFACQASAGLRYEITPNAELDLGYKFLATFGHDWDLGYYRYLKIQDIYTHAALVSFTWKF